MFVGSSDKSKTESEPDLTKSKHPETAIEFLEELLGIFEKVVRLKRKSEPIFKNC